MLCTFPVKSPPDCKISLYLHSPIFAINIDIGAERPLFLLGKKLRSVASENSCLTFNCLKS